MSALGLVSIDVRVELSIIPLSQVSIDVVEVVSIDAVEAGHRPLDPHWKELRFPGSPLEGTPVPRYGVFRVRSQDCLPSSGKWKTSDKENLPYFRIWMSLTYSNGLRPALGRLYKGNPNPKARDRHFKTWRLGFDG
ncbi:hypothetical protein F2Q69_00034957 [Brassica cretica]|uniref:Uncharacterized protein n=1 Tax=Brassica cretica TaxID=69181 RepID=A0A8S9SS49_BRACR|nr:hypothetical protein F2Q69_00034957 [Brassica cretica]